MTGPEHYREAERLIALAADPYAVDLTQSERNTIALGAQVHATLALAAATALNLQTPPGGLIREDWEAWADTASECNRTAEELSS